MKSLSISFGQPALRASLLAGILAFGLGACAQDIQVRGNIPDVDVVSKINPGIHSRIDIQSLLGSPSTISTFQDSKWYYIGQKSTQFAFFEQKVFERFRASRRKEREYLPFDVQGPSVRPRRAA